MSELLIPLAAGVGVYAVWNALSRKTLLTEQQTEGEHHPPPRQRFQRDVFLAHLAPDQVLDDVNHQEVTYRVHQQGETMEGNVENVILTHGGGKVKLGALYPITRAK